MDIIVCQVVQVKKISKASCRISMRLQKAEESTPDTFHVGHDMRAVGRGVRNGSMPKD